MDNPYDKPERKARYYVNCKEVTDPKGKAKVSLTFVFVLSFFAFILIAVTIFLTVEALNPGDFTYSYKEDSHVNNVTYTVTVVDRTGEHGDATSFTAMIDMGYSSSKKTVTNFDSKKDGDKTTYTFTIQITGEAWADVEGISDVTMKTSLGSYEPEYNSGINMIWIAYIAIGIFLAVIIGLIVFNAKDAAKHFREAKEELNSKIQTTQNAVMTNKTVTEVSEPQVPEKQDLEEGSQEIEISSNLAIRCPYCGTINSDTASRCKTCDAPLR